MIFSCTFSTADGGLYCQPVYLYRTIITRVFLSIFTINSFLPYKKIVGLQIPASYFVHVRAKFERLEELKSGQIIQNHNFRAFRQVRIWFKGVWCSFPEVNDILYHTTTPENCIYACHEVMTCWSSAASVSVQLAFICKSMSTPWF